MFWNRFYHITQVKDHKENKDRIFSQISQNPLRPFYNTEVSYRSVISNTDWQNDSSQRDPRWYLQALSERDQLNFENNIFKKYHKGFMVRVAWYNQYYPHSNSEHIWHNHYDVNNRIHDDLTNIYYVELGDKSLTTVLEHPETGKEIIPKVKEGQILTFDSRIMHKSPPNNTSTRKTIISFNLKFI